MERMKEDWVMKRMMGSDVRGVRLRGRPWMGLMNCVKRTLNERGMYVEKGRIIVHDRGECRTVMYA